jgi:DNA polymerase
MKVDTNNLYVLDFETYYDNKYSVKHMGTLEYILDKRFHVHGCAMKPGDRPAVWVPGVMVPKMVDVLRKAKVAVLCHNAKFDCGILAYRYGWVPERIFDTSGMAACRGMPNLSLDHVAKELGFGGKTEGVLDSVSGMRDLPKDLLRSLSSYACRDAELTREVFDHLFPATPPNEIKLIQWTIQIFLRPLFCVDVKEIDNLLIEVVKREKDAIERAGVPLEVLRSTKRLAAWLADMGINVPTKPGAKGPIPALAQTDDWLRDNIGKDTFEGLVAEARMTAASPLIRTRLGKFRKIGELLSQPGGPKAFGADLIYYGAHTGRWSGAGGLNFQNLPVRDPKFGKRIRSILRPALFEDTEAGLGSEAAFVAGDLAQIEARVIAWLAGEERLLAAFRDPDRDPYIEFGSEWLYRRPIEPGSVERKVSKASVLGSLYGMSSNRLVEYCKQFGVPMSPEMAGTAVSAFRRFVPKVVSFWYDLVNSVSSLAGWMPPARVGRLTVYRDYIVLPSDRSVHYRNTHYGADRSIVADVGAGDKRRDLRLWHGLMAENITQAVARDVLGEIIVRLMDGAEAGNYPSYMIPIMATHDDIVCRVPASRLDEAADLLHRVMTQPIPWASDLPLSAEIKKGANYGDL